MKEECRDQRNNEIEPLTMVIIKQWKCWM